MSGVRKRRDSALIDAIEALPPVPHSGKVWRVARTGRSPIQCSRSGGRWDDGTFDVLYTSEKREGALAEMKFHLMRGQPVMPSLVTYDLHELAVTMDRVLKLLDLDALRSLGMDTSRYGQASYDGRLAEYPRSQDIAEVAHFLDFDGMAAPSARHPCLNIIPFCDRLKPEALQPVKNHGVVNWTDYPEL
jgi:RES domain-containing protein